MIMIMIMIIFIEMTFSYKIWFSKKDLIPLDKKIQPILYNV